ncbi:KGW motif small protein [Acinetobacter haemolyticus]|nr:KGW motif small protein [Acinetobacter haemolyticus]
MMKNENYMRTIHIKGKGWFWFGLTVVLQILFISLSYVLIKI